MQVLTERLPSNQRPLSSAQLEKLGVRVRNKHELSLECLACGEIWAPQRRPDGSFPHGYWQCPNRCNG